MRAEHGVRSDPHVVQLEIDAPETADTQRILTHHSGQTWRLERERETR